MKFIHFLLRVKWPTVFYGFVKAVTEHSPSNVYAKI